MFETIFEGVTIAYAEHTNTWNVDDEANGITLSRDSLSGAKDAVKAALKKSEKGNFKRFDVWYFGYYSRKSYRKVTVTSRVENKSSYSSDEYWITGNSVGETGRKLRAKVYASDLFKDTKANAERISKIIELDGHIAALEKKRCKLADGLVSLERNK